MVEHFSFFRRKRDKPKETIETTFFRLHEKNLGRSLNLGEVIIITEGNIDVEPPSPSISFRIDLSRPDLAHIEMNWAGENYHTMQWGNIDSYVKKEDSPKDRPKYERKRSFSHSYTRLIQTKGSDKYIIPNTPLSFSADFRCLYLNDTPLITA